MGEGEHGDESSPARRAGDSAVRARFEMALRAGGVGTWRWDIRSGTIDWDSSMEELYGFAPGTFDGTYESYAARLHPDDRERMQADLRQALDARSPEYTVDHRVLLPDGAVRWFSSTAHLRLDAAGEPAELIGVAVDVTAQRVAEQAAQSAQRRLEMLARASGLLDSPLDLDGTLQQVADVAIGELADWCSVDVMSGGQVHHAAIAHREPRQVEFAREIQRRLPNDPNSPVLQRLLQTLEPVFVAHFDDALLDTVVVDPEGRAMLRQLRISSYLVVPLVAAGRGVGSMLLLSCDGRHLDEEDVELAVELGRRAGAAVDKARLYDDLRRTTDALQASLLPVSLPEVPGVALAAHYRSGTDGIDIGGDFYDVFRTGPDRWWLALGDVCGKGSTAAALTAAVRHTLHAVAFDTDDPALVLRRLNEVLCAQDWGDRFTTVVLATFLVAPSTGPLALHLASGGHPPPMVRRADGHVEVVPATGRLIGILPEVEASTVEVVLAAGDAMLLYTDGATEARDPSGTELGPDTLRHLLGTTDGAVASIAAGLLARTDGVLHDDLALLTLTR